MDDERIEVNGEPCIRMDRLAYWLFTVDPTESNISRARRAIASYQEEARIAMVGLALTDKGRAEFLNEKVFGKNYSPSLRNAFLNCWPPDEQGRQQLLAFGTGEWTPEPC